ncbi:transposase [Algoriphagus sp. D3-2-R+10]|uniref:transposase n=1 Tax=Algoriphagus aurantiacus TaxID=3103948 RepID=UPI002B3FD6B3|nr:transposase [Algoriphagus sp. D3-2-R+10]MEB2778137.1 transposase [Algoriphagus sp. D3-2-R+10]
MKNQNITPNDRILLRKRAIIECVNDELKNMCKLEYTRHRSVNNFLINILGALTAYCFFPKNLPSTSNLNYHPSNYPFVLNPISR